MLHNSDTGELLTILAYPEGVPHVLKFSRDGSVLLRHLTSERTLLRFEGRGNPAEAGLLTPTLKVNITSRMEGEEPRGGGGFRWRTVQVVNGTERKVQGTVQRSPAGYGVELVPAVAVG